MLQILRRVIEVHLCQASGASSHARLGAVSFIHRFGSSLNRHVHYHCCVIDGVFEPAPDDGDAVRFRPATALTPDALAALAEQVRVRVLRWVARSGLIEPDDVREMLAWDNSGFSLDAAVRVAAPDHASLERLLRYCARPPFALERLALRDAEPVVYRLPKPRRDYAGNNIANSRLKWGLRIARTCLRGGGAGRAQASIALVVDVALGVDGEFR